MCNFLYSSTHWRNNYFKLNHTICICIQKILLSFIPDSWCIRAFIHSCGPAGGGGYITGIIGSNCGWNFCISIYIIIIRLKKFVLRKNMNFMWNNICLEVHNYRTGLKKGRKWMNEVSRISSIVSSVPHPIV